MTDLDIDTRAAAGRVRVAPGGEIQSGWGNLVFDQSVNVFASTADRDTQWPAPTDGSVCYTQAEASVWARISGAWVKFAPPAAPPTIKPQPVSVYMAKASAGYSAGTYTLFTGTLPSLSVAGTLIGTLYGAGGFTGSGTSGIKPDLTRTDTSASLLAFNTQTFNQPAAQTQAWSVPLVPLAIPAGSAIPVSCSVVLTTSAATVYTSAYLLGHVYAT